MPASDFAKPEKIVVDEKTLTVRYARFLMEPWEKGYGHTIGNALRRVLLSSLEGVAVTSVRIDGVKHEFSAIPNVVEDVTEIILNLKQLKLRCHGETPRTLELVAEKAGPVTAANVREDGVTEVINKDLLICTLDKDQVLRMEIEIDRGRGYRPADENKNDEQPIGVIPVDSLFSPVERVAYHVHACRVGQRTDYDSLELEVWTDGRVGPQEALRTAAEILRQHLEIFGQVEGEVPPAAEDMAVEGLSDEERELLKKLCLDVKELKLAARARNCLNSAGIRVLGELVQKTDQELLQYKNFGKKSLSDIKQKLEPMGLSLGMPLSEHIISAMQEVLNRRQEGADANEE